MQRFTVYVDYAAGRWESWYGTEHGKRYFHSHDIDTAIRNAIRDSGYKFSETKIVHVSRKLHLNANH